MRTMISAVFAATATFATVAQAETWDMPTPYPDGNFHTQNIRQFVEDIKTATNGELTINVHSGGALVKPTDIKRAVQSGQVQIGEVLLSSLGNEDVVFAFDSIPGLVSDYASAEKLWHAAQATVKRHLEEQGLVLLYSVPWPPQGVYSKEALTSLGDLKGLKFRTYNPATARFAELNGANPVTVQAAEVPQAFKTGVVDAMITSGATGVDSQAWDYLSYYYDLQAFLPQNMVFVSKDVFDGLSEETREAVVKAAAEAETRGWKQSAELNEGYKKTMAEHGIHVEPPSEAMAKELSAIGDTMTAEWIEKAGEDGAAIIDAYRK
ncbi:TRAP transporter substrate-binding protein [Sinorhizobium alkalisoli]|uniref:C4-dicarboxylate ABC transporter substrate-binding protein n=1 Tax=Sinorhizobium alkalisoli TaxID=1752398 RepID=A0A1E3VED1_9HYPH|nr:TRAP transporter substrate-binding protein [Sinorhizobium alkalisoli]MCA1493799.1 TRAP transporter substrate-binding protein [Ensifer sp. NBAIM29]MCG5479653.1 TRAP transporter substrate-binding protein [Sinorhizobium alkalisoli]ODR91236.1 C4-dicarboxylate ABC transporter substrate-binding protein [Sinorhizobium alkalisoli]QFI66696.1 TRAP transporter solute receptor, unknown substrate 5 [Sinorhizobium alkalisoli]